jgi:hypothetical protein
MSRFRVILLALALGCGNPGNERPELAFAPDALPEGQVGREYTVAITVSGNETPVGSLELDEGSLPPGLALLHAPMQQVGFVDGTPTQPGTFAFAIRAACYGTMLPGQVGTKGYAIVVR